MRYRNEYDTLGVADLGLAFQSDEERKEFTEIIQEELEVRVGRAIKKSLSPRQTEEFESIMGDGGYDLSEWLEDNCPQYREICNQVMDDLERRYWITGNLWHNVSVRQGIFGPGANRCLAPGDLSSCCPLYSQEGRIMFR